MDNNTTSVDAPFSFVDRSISNMHTFYLSGEIKPASEYVQWFEKIRTATEQDVIMLRINSFGGDLFTAIQFMRVMRESKANIVASIEGACMSAATLIFLSAKHWEISRHSMFMFHNYTNMIGGKGGEMYDNIIHERKWSEKLWRDAYADFLTSEEITDILQNKDIWMTGEDVLTRLVKRAAKQDATLKGKKGGKKPLKVQKTRSISKSTMLANRK